jgi:hypothetical protein
MGYFAQWGGNLLSAGSSAKAIERLSSRGSPIEQTIFLLKRLKAGLTRARNSDTTTRTTRRQKADQQNPAHNRWSNVGSGMGGQGYTSVGALAVSGSDLYAGGYFTRAGGSPANYVAKWNGSIWSPLGSGMGGNQFPFVYALAMWSSDVYAAGEFTTAGGSPANRIAKWNGSSWSSLDSGIGGWFWFSLCFCAGRIAQRPVCWGQFHHGRREGFGVLSASLSGTAHSFHPSLRRGCETFLANLL